MLQDLFFSIDLALMVLQRQKMHTAGAAFHYFVVDSSPQGNRNWLLSKSTTLDANRCLEVAAAANCLATDLHSAAQKFMADVGSCCIDVFLAQLKVIRDNLIERCCVPAAIGLSHANTAHKAAGFLHSIMLEVEARSLQQMLMNTISFTGDLGVEIGIPGFRSAVDNLLPPWRQQSLEPLQCEDSFLAYQEETLLRQCSPSAHSRKSNSEDATNLTNKDWTDEAEVSFSRRGEPISSEAALDLELDAYAVVMDSREPQTQHGRLDGSASFCGTKCESNASILGSKHMLCGEIALELDVHTHAATSSILGCSDALKSCIGSASTAALCFSSGPLQASSPAAAFDSDSSLLSIAWKSNPAWHSILLPFAIPVPGMLHVTNNLLADVDSGMTYWDTFWEQLENVSSLLSNTMRLDKFRAKCIDATHADAREAMAMFAAKINVLYSKRWGSVSHFLASSWDRLHMLRLFWDAHLYAGQEQEDGGGTRFNPMQLTATLRCNKFFAYCEMLQLLHRSIDELAGWSEGCFCHPPWLGEAGICGDGRGFSHRRGMRSETRQTFLGSSKACPMQGCRAPEMAIGQWKIFNDNLLKQSFVNLAHTHQSKLDSFSAAGSHMNDTISLCRPYRQMCRQCRLHTHTCRTTHPEMLMPPHHPQSFQLNLHRICVGFVSTLFCEPDCFVIKKVKMFAEC